MTAGSTVSRGRTPRLPGDRAHSRRSHTQRRRSFSSRAKAINPIRWVRAWRCIGRSVRPVCRSRWCSTPAKTMSPCRGLCVARRVWNLGMASTSGSVSRDSLRLPSLRQATASEHRTRCRQRVDFHAHYVRVANVVPRGTDGPASLASAKHRRTHPFKLTMRTRPTPHARSATPPWGVRLGFRTTSPLQIANSGRSIQLMTFSAQQFNPTRATPRGLRHEAYLDML